MQNVNDIKKDAQTRMQKSVDALKHELQRLRTGRASTALIEPLKVSYYGTDTPVMQVANVAIADSRSIMITPYEKNMVGPVEKAILASDLGLTPTTVGNVIRINLPPLDHKEVHSMIYDIMNDSQRKHYDEILEVDFSFDLPGLARFRVNAFNQDRGAAAVLRTSRVPVFCIPESPQIPSHHLRGPARSILIATDLSDASSEVVAAGYAALQPQGGRVELFTVREVGLHDAIAQVPLVPPLGEEQRANLEARLRELVPPGAALAGIVTHVSVGQGTTAAEAILTAAERMDVDLIAVGSHGRSGFTRAVLGSVAEEVARNSTRPVLLVRARGGRAPS